MNSRESSLEYDTYDTYDIHETQDTYEGYDTGDTYGTRDVTCGPIVRSDYTHVFGSGRYGSTST